MAPQMEAPDLEAPDLEALEHGNMIEAIALAAASAPGSLVRRTDGVALIASGLAMRLFNEVIVERDDAPASAVETAVDTFRARGDRFVVNLRMGRDDRFRGLMGQLGLTPISAQPWMPGMALHPIAPNDAPIEAGHEIRRVTDRVGVEDHVRVAAEGFVVLETVLRTVLGPALLGHPDAAVYVGYTDGLPVSSGLGIRTGRTIGIYIIATLPAFRKRGYGTAMTARIIADGVAAGADVAILQSSEMGYPIYERLGFRTVVEYIGYIDPASVAAPA